MCIATMRTCLLYLFIFTACIASAVPVKELEPGPDVALLNEVTRTEDDFIIFFILYTRLNPTVEQPLYMGEFDSVANSNFNGRVPTVVLIPDWTSNFVTDPSFYPSLRDVFLEKSDVNVIVLDWRYVGMTGYILSTERAPAIGRGLGEFVAYLNMVSGAQFNTFHLVGIGIGAHIAGAAGRQLGRRAARITALDPAGSLWTTNPNRITRNDAIYVEAIHTNGDNLGYGIGSAVANADFFPNGGRTQPGCNTTSCHHNRAWELFASTLRYDHLVGRECTNALQFQWNNCRGQRLNMGNDSLTKFGTGTYRLATGGTYPY